jgi:ribonuclease P protein component
MHRSLRLRREWEVNETRRRGKAHASGPLVARILPQTTPQPANRYAVIAGKRVGKAVQRNRAKRLVREALRHLHPQLKQGYDIAVIVRGGLDELPGLQVASDSLTRIFTQARLLDRPAEPPPPAGETGEPGP